MSFRIASIAGAALLVLVVLLGWFARTPSIDVDVALVRSGPLTVRVATNGVIEPIEKSEVRARLDGRVLEIPKAGAELRAGDLLLKLDAGPTAAELASAESSRLLAVDSLREARGKLRRAERRADHDRRLFGDQAITQERLDETLADHAEARARVRFLEAEVPLRTAALDLRIAELRAQRDGAEVRASFDGTVYKTSARPGERVRSGDAVVWFADLTRPRVRANVDQVDLGRVRIGQVVQITSNAYPDRTRSAEIEQLIPNVVKKQSRFVAEALAPVAAPATGLLPGMGVDVEIAVDAVPDALQIPSDALLRDGEGSFVYRVDGDRVRVRRVLVGRSTVGSVEVVEGLAAGDQVVVGPFSLRDGERVTLAKTPQVGARDGD